MEGSQKMNISGEELRKGIDIKLEKDNPYLIKLKSIQP